ncbi:MAG: hypothetical protein F8N37_08615 [Telmatospirillum sp.]|nr:hypothetical protein [Telmatospirillum sp.]
MTTRKKPSRPQPPAAEQNSIAHAFILAVDQRARAEAAHLPEEASAPSKRKKDGKQDKGKGPMDQQDPIIVEPEEKAEGKSKEKARDKGKGKRKKDRKKEAVLIRFEDDQLQQIDSAADQLGLSRAAWVRMVVAQALSGSGRQD